MDRVIQFAEKFFQDCGVREFSDFTLVLRELLINAVVHGNQSDADRLLTCRLAYVGDGRFTICVEDVGEGFNYDALDTAVPVNPRHVRHRGYTLINAFSDRIEFNGRGNCITAYVTAQPGHHAEVRMQPAGL